MLCRGRFRWRGPRRRGGLSSVEQLLLSLLAGLLLAALAITAFQLRLRPVLVEVAAAGVDNAVSLAVSEVMAQDIALGVVDYEDLICIETDDAGRPVALKSNMGEANLLRAHILHRLVRELDSLTAEELRIPLGNLTGNLLLSGLGPSVPVRVLSVGSAATGFENQFSAAGINQTRHQLVLRVSVTVNLLLPGGVVRHRSDSRITVAETVLLGQVPEHYAYLTPFGQEGEMTG